MRYTNPHIHHGHPATMQPIRQPMQPMQQPMQQPMMQPHQQGNMIMTDQGPMMQIMTPQGLMLVPPQQFINQYPQQQMITQPSPSVVNTTRFTGNQQISYQNFEQTTTEGSRYQMPTSTQTSTQEEAKRNKPIPFTVKPNIHKFVSNEKFKLNTITSETKESSVKYIDVNVVCDCLQENIESLIESAYEEENNSLVTLRDFIVTNSFYKTDIKSIIKELMSSDIKSVYKQMKVLYSEATDKYQINVYDKIDNILTDKINDYIAINAKQFISIDSFISDFNDLLKVIRNTEEDLEDQLLEYMDNYIRTIHDITDSIECPECCTVVNEYFTMAYIDKHVIETGLNDIDGDFVVLENTPPNLFLISIIKNISNKAKTKEFLLITIDRTIFKCMVNEKGRFFIKLFEQ